jgi:hypothetical protein
MEFEPAICGKAAVYQMTGVLVRLLSRPEQPEGFVHQAKRRFLSDT